MEKEELLKRICDLKRNNSGEVAIKGNKYVIVKSCDFTNITFSHLIHIENVVFVNCRLINACFSYMTLESGMFIDCDLTGSEFTNSVLSDILILKSTGEKVLFLDCFFSVVEFKDVRMSNVHINIHKDDDESYISINSSVIKNIKLSDINSKSRINIEYSHLHNACITNSCIGDSFVIRGSVLKKLYIDDTSVYSSIIQDSDLSNSYITRSEYFSPMCNNVNFTESEFDCCEIDGAKFVDCDMSRVKFDCNSIQNVYFRNCALINTEMSECYRLRNSDFESSKFIYTDLRNSNLYDCNFSGCVMRDIKLNQTKFTRISESNPNRMEWFSIVDLDGVKWDGLGIASIDDDTLKCCTIKKQIVYEFRRRNTNA